MDKESKIIVVGHGDVIEKAIVEGLKGKGFTSVLPAAEMGLKVTDQTAVNNYFVKQQPHYVFLCSTKSGGIEANRNYPAEFIYNNLISSANVIHASYQVKVKKLLFIGSSCVYPKEAPQPIKEESLMTGLVEETSESYAVAKIAGIKMCQAYLKQYGFPTVVAIPATVYGPGEEAELQMSHVLGALIKKFHDAVKKGVKEVVIWGTGKPRREFIYRDDFTEAVFLLMETRQKNPIVNIGCGTDVSIKELAELIAKVAAFQGKIVFDATKPDGVQQKLLDSSRVVQMGWKPKVGLEEGIKRTLEWYKGPKN